MLAALLLVLVVATAIQGTEDAVYYSAFGWLPSLEEYPWVVAVYRENETKLFSHICGGSLISEYIVLSAAHCFWNEGVAVPADEYRITSGNIYRDFYAVEPEKQVHELKKVTIHERYRHYHGNFAHDIAIVWLQDKANFTLSVQPINIDWDNEFEDTNLEGQSGTVVGWGFTEDNSPSEKRQAVKLAYRNFDQCWETVPSTFRSLVTADKFCAGHRNGTAVCPGDSGGGLACQDPDTSIWYLRGIVSVGVQTKNYAKCHPSQYSAFSSISSNYLWLKKRVNVTS